MRNNNLQNLEPFSPDKLVKDLGKLELGGKASSLLLAAEHLPPEELAILARIAATNTPGVLDEVSPFSQDMLDEFWRMYR